MNKFQQARWATFDELTSLLHPLNGEQPIPMSDSDATALPLLLDDSGEKNFGADLIRFEAGKGVALHEHQGSHILLVTGGFGTLTYYRDGTTETYPMTPGMIYLVPSSVAHAIEAHTELVLVAIGNDHQSASSKERLNLV